MIRKEEEEEIPIKKINLPGILNLFELSQFQVQLKDAFWNEQKILCVRRLLHSNPEILTQFSTSQGMETIINYLDDSTNHELLEWVFQLLFEIKLTLDLVEQTKIRQKILLLQKDSSLPLSLQKQVSKYFDRYRSILLFKWKKKSKKYNQSQKSVEPKKQKKIKKEENTKVRFAHDLIVYKVFKRDDEPNAKGMTKEELSIFQKKYRDSRTARFIMTNEQIKHLESLMEGNQHIQLNDDQMEEQMEYPKKLLKIKPHRPISQKLMVQDKISIISDIPDEPSYEFQNKSNPEHKPQTIAVEIPSNEDIRKVVQIICSIIKKRAIRKQEQKAKISQIKGILKKREVEEIKKDDSKVDIERLLERLSEMIKNRHQSFFDHFQLFHLVLEISNKLSELGKPECISNVETLVNTTLLKEETKQVQQRFSTSYSGLNQRYKPFRTKPCFNFNSPSGCLRGKSCHFFHDYYHQQNYAYR